MRFIADFHIHSHYSRATSKNLTPEHLEYWARLKGITVLGTGDCIHPGWLAELREKLEPAGNSLLRLKREYRLAESEALDHPDIPSQVYFLLTGEISSIYKKNDRVRKVHNLLVFPDFDAVERLQARLSRIGNIGSDGRPIIGLDARNLLEMHLETSAYSFLVPAHIWTPWFSVLGSKSGFDSIVECFDDLAPEIFAVETGLSSDPPMNRACSFLDRYALISNSDAHSPEKLGREANIFDTEIDYFAIYNALKKSLGFAGTIEFFPQEGKYHYDGHRACGVRYDPLETLRHDGICPVCEKPLVRGVLYRVAELADRSADEAYRDGTVYHSITQLADLLAEVLGTKSGSSKAVQRQYFDLLHGVGSEFHLLLDAPLSAIEKYGSPLIAEGVRRLREGRVMVEEGFDGEFGRVRVFESGERAASAEGTLFSGASLPAPPVIVSGPATIEFSIREFQQLHAMKMHDRPAPIAAPEPAGLDREQRRAAEHGDGPCLVIAGPGSGKTRVLTERIAHLVERCGIAQKKILAITFSNKAAGEIRERIERKIDGAAIMVSTFHAFGLSILREHHTAAGIAPHFSIIDAVATQEIAKTIFGDGPDFRARCIAISALKQGMPHADSAPADERLLRTAMNNQAVVDLDDLIYLPVQILENNPVIAEACRERFPWVLIDEFQDINAMQYRLLRCMLNPSGQGLFAIGDPDQAIYGFRGSDPRYIETLASDYPALERISLSRSYRCPDPLLRAAGQALAKSGQMRGVDDAVLVHIRSCESEKSEADWIAATIERMMGGVRSFSRDSGISDDDSAYDGASFSDFAILTRTRSLFQPLITALDNHGIAWQAVGTDSALQEDPYRRVVELFRDLWLERGPAIDPDAIDHARRQMITGAAIADILAPLAMASGIDDERCRRLITLTRPYGNDYPRFFDSLALRAGIDDFEYRAEAVTLMTLHASKGLEFKNVFIAGCEQGIIPFELFEKKGDDERREEERLLYVGMTRASMNLFLSHAAKRLHAGRILSASRSPFLDRIDSRLLHMEQRTHKRKKDEDDGQLNLFD